MNAVAPLQTSNAPIADNNTVAKEKKPDTGLSKEELIAAAEKLKSEVLCELQYWPMHCSDHRTIIRLLERYKRLVRKLVRRCSSGEDPFRRLLRALAQLAAQSNTGDKRGRKGPVPHRKAVSDPAAADERQHGKLAQKRLKLTATRPRKNVWAQVDAYFWQISPETRAALDSLTMTAEELDPVIFRAGLLNMHAVNRLAAVAKMLEYCRENKMGVAQFMEDRTYQKVRSRQRQEGAADSLVNYPSPEELDYLLRLGQSRVEDTILQLKSLLTVSDDSQLSETEQQTVQKADSTETSHDSKKGSLSPALTSAANPEENKILALQLETELATLSHHNAALISRLRSRMECPAASSTLGPREQIEEKYAGLLLAGTKRRRKRGGGPRKRRCDETIPGKDQPSGRPTACVHSRETLTPPAVAGVSRFRALQGIVPFPSHVRRNHCL